MTVSNVHIYYPSQITPVTGVLVAQTVSAFDLRKIICWNDGTAVGATAIVNVRYDFNGSIAQIWPKTEFEAAKTASLAAGG